MTQSLNDRLLDHLGTCERKLQEAHKAERPVFQAALDARDEARAAVLKNMVPAEPATIFDALNGEWSVAWADRSDEDQICVDPSNGVRRFVAMYEAGERFCVCIPDGFDDEGDWDGWHYEWFLTEIAAKAALAAAERATAKIKARSAPDPAP